MIHVQQILLNNYYFLRKEGWQPQFEYLKNLTIISKYAKSTSKFQNYVLFWIGFNFLIFWQIGLIYFTSFLVAWVIGMV